MNAQTLYRTLWRWHFYAGLFVIPFIIILSLSGAVYLFKPQIERWEEQDFRNLPTTNSVTPSAQVAVSLGAHPQATFESYRLSLNPSDAALVSLKNKNRGKLDVFVSPQGKIVGTLDPHKRIAKITSEIHGELLADKPGSWAVELAASWAIVMILTGLYLWWPTGGALAGVIYPRLNAGKRLFWRDIHSVTGFWVSGLVLILLVTGMPWASVWGDAFKMVRENAGWVKSEQEWKTGAAKSEDAHAEHHAIVDASKNIALLDIIATNARAENLAFPVLIRPPGIKARFAKQASPDWVVKSEAQNRTLGMTHNYDAMTGTEISRTGFANKHIIDRVIGYGISWHEGQLFGWINQAIGVMTAVALITMSVSGFILWRRRKPIGTIGAPPLPDAAMTPKIITGIILLLACLLPLLAASLILLWVFERFILPHMPRTSRWLMVGA
jgi:uncharacterized iron-regulated membrane protein